MQRVKRRRREEEAQRRRAEADGLNLDKLRGKRWVTPELVSKIVRRDLELPRLPTFPVATCHRLARPTLPD